MTTDTSSSHGLANIKVILNFPLCRDSRGIDDEDQVATEHGISQGERVKLPFGILRI